jgi:uncharacterized membrane protein
MPFYISPPPRNPLTGIIAGIIGVITMVGVFMLGFVAIVIALVFGMVIWLGIYIRVWWARRQMIKQGIDPESLNPFAKSPQEPARDSLDAEYEVISRSKDE